MLSDNKEMGRHILILWKNLLNNRAPSFIFVSEKLENWLILANSNNTRDLSQTWRITLNLEYVKGLLYLEKT
jgi:hypothetical protein